MPLESNEPCQHSYRTEVAIWCLTIFGTVLVCLGVMLLVSRAYCPDITPALELAERLTIFLRGAIRPEPQEKVLFLSCLATVSVSLPLFYLLARWLVGRFPLRIVPALCAGLLALSVSAVIWLGYKGLTAPNPFEGQTLNGHDVAGPTNGKFYFISTYLHAHPYLYTLLVFPLVFLMLLFEQYRQGRIPEAVRRGAGICYRIWFLILILATVAINTFSFPHTLENRVDFSAVYYSMVQVYHGSPLLVDGFTNTYGLYPHFLVPIFKLIGLTVATFSGTMAVMIALCYLLLLYFLQRTITSRLLVFLAFNAIIFYSQFYFKTVIHFNAVFVAQPIRFVLPMGALFLSVLYLRKRSEFIRLASLFFLSFGILWNPEYGVLTFIAFLLFLCYVELLKDPLSIAWRRMAGHLLTAPVVLLASFAGYSCAIRLGYGSFPALGEMFNTIRIFSVIGANMLPMSLLHPWNLIALIYAIGLLASFTAVIHRSGSDRPASLFLVTMLGIATFSYYQGRSHNWTLTSTAVFFFILLAMFADFLVKKIRTERLFAVPLLLITFVLGFSFLQVGYCAPALGRLLAEQQNKEDNQLERAMILANAGFIRENSLAGESVFILSANYRQGIYYGLADRRAAINPGFIDLFWRADLDRIVAFLGSNTQTKIFFEPIYCKFDDNRIMSTLVDFYEIDRAHGEFFLLKRKVTK